MPQQCPVFTGGCSGLPSILPRHSNWNNPKGWTPLQAPHPGATLRLERLWRTPCAPCHSLKQHKCHSSNSLFQSKSKANPISNRPSGREQPCWHCTQEMWPPQAHSRQPATGHETLVGSAMPREVAWAGAEKLPIEPSSCCNTSGIRQAIKVSKGTKTEPRQKVRSQSVEE